MNRWSNPDERRPILGTLRRTRGGLGVAFEPAPSDQGIDRFDAPRVRSAERAIDALNDVELRFDVLARLAVADDDPGDFDRGPRAA